MKISALLVIIMGTAFGVFAQTPGAPHSPNNPLPGWVHDNARKRSEFERMTKTPPSGMTPGTIVVSRRRDPKAEEARAEINAMLLPAPAYLETYGKFLKRSKNGIFRIFVDAGCDKGLTVSVEELGKCRDAIPIKGGGSLFSFRYGGSHLGIEQDFWDLHFVDGELIAGNDSVEGLIAEVGGDFEKINLKDAAFKAFGKYEPKRSTTEIRTQNERLAKRLEINGYTFLNSAVAKLNSVYALRIVAYKPRTPKNLSPYKRLFGRGLDLRIAFKIVGQESDGSLVVIWKELKRDLPRRELAD